QTLPGLATRSAATGERGQRGEWTALDLRAAHPVRVDPGGRAAAWRGGLLGERLRAASALQRGPWRATRPDLRRGAAAALVLPAQPGGRRSPQCVQWRVCDGLTLRSIPERAGLGDALWRAGRLAPSARTPLAACAACLTRTAAAATVGGCAARWSLRAR